jgi:chorismate mutase/prephenate dehydratase
MSDTGESDARALAKLRDRIDKVDAKMHALLIQRGTVIDALIRTKGTGRPGAAFRPGREADMMRRLVGRHEGALPLATVEHIWREIITTFTHMQAPFDVVFDASVEPDRMRDVARFVFGFSVALKPVANATAVVAAVAEANDLGLIARVARGAWWRDLVGPAAPKIMAMLPFISANQRPADLPSFVISPPLADPTPFDVAVLALTIDEAMKSLDDGAILAVAGSDVLFAMPGAVDPASVNARLEKAGVKVLSLSPVGGFARGITADGRPTALYEKAAP